MKNNYMLEIFIAFELKICHNLDQMAFEQIMKSKGFLRGGAILLAHIQ